MGLGTERRVPLAALVLWLFATLVAVRVLEALLPQVQALLWATHYIPSTAPVQLRSTHWPPHSAAPLAARVLLWPTLQLAASSPSRKTIPTQAAPPSAQVP